MDFFEELGKQTSKMLNNFATTMNEITTMATTSADSAANIVLLKGKLESLKIELNNLYKEIGELIVTEPEKDHSQIILKATEKLNEIKSIESSIENLKNEIAKKREQTKQTAITGAEKMLQDSKDSFDQQAERVKDFIDTRTQEAELKYDQVIDDIEKKDDLDSE